MELLITPNHDNLRLAVIIFPMLCHGLHPFSVDFSGGVICRLEARIQRITVRPPMLKCGHHEMRPPPGKISCLNA